ncbi:MAG: beta-ketoacyl synthase N-terminal-like domain-containing protein [Chloroflexota bacterium]|nr:beta-ketoacyl synthase N-terminal-like domain-containing protein [Chloroflexota bacterium]
MTDRSRESPVAIVGYSYRMPGGIRGDPDFWRLLRDRGIAQEPVTDRYRRGYRPIGRFSGPGRFASPYEGLIREDGEKLIDPKLFGLSQDEVLAMGPQVRMLLNCAWEACERVGWRLDSLHNSATGVFGAAFPSWKLEGLRRLLHAVTDPEARVLTERYGDIAFDFTRLLRNCASLAAERRRYPEIARQEVRRPVFIVGINRTGTTFLHRLMSRGPRFWTLRGYEYVEPVLAGGDYAALAGSTDDPRRATGTSCRAGGTEHPRSSRAGTEQGRGGA